MPLDLACTNEQKIRVIATPKTPSGNPAELDGPIQVEVTSGDATVEPIDDLAFYVVSGQNPGPSTFVVTADADLGAGIVPISDGITLNVSGAMASNLGIAAEPPEPK